MNRRKQIRRPSKPTSPEISVREVRSESFKGGLVWVQIDNPSLVEQREGCLVPYTMLLPKDARKLASQIIAIADRAEA